MLPEYNVRIGKGELLSFQKGEEERIKGLQVPESKKPRVSRLENSLCWPPPLTSGTQEALSLLASQPGG